MKILLVQPPIRDAYRTAFREYPLGLLYLATPLARAGHEVSLLDARRCRRPKAVAPYAEIAHMGELYEGTDLFSGFYHFGLGYDEIARVAVEIGPDAVCVSSMFTPYEREVMETAAAVKRVLPNCSVIVGGCHASADPGALAQCAAIDAVVCGEGERILPDVIASGARGIIRADGGGALQDVDSIAFPAREFLDAGAYRLGRRPYAMVVTSRGCPHRCSFCSSRVVSGSAYRARSVESVIAEVDECVGRFGARAIDFQDDNLLFARERARGLLAEIARRYRGRGVLFLASNGLNVAHLDREILGLMKDAGFKKLDLAIGTGDVASRHILERPESMERYEEVLAGALEFGLAVTTYIIIGMPEQPLSEMNATADYLMAKETLISPSVFYNVPGMPVFEEMKEYEYVRANVARRSTAVNCHGRDFGREEVMALFQRIRRHNLARFRA